MTNLARTGQFQNQPEGYKAFIPAPLPPNPPLKMDDEMVQLLSNADLALGRLDGAATTLPNPDLVVAMYVRQEAVLSSQIEGTQSTLEDVLEYEVDGNRNNHGRGVEEVVNYVKALNYGLRRLETLPLSLRLIREIHEQLLRGTRGEHLTPGEFRRSQNWIGPPGSTLATASFVPPPVHEMHNALSDLERFLYNHSGPPILIQCGLMHAQFETIHPFLDGNGRVGRLLITLLLCQRGVLRLPLLYLSLYLKANRAEYYDRLTSVRIHGDWEGWLKFYLRGVAQISNSSVELVRRILQLRESHQQLVVQQIGGAAQGLRLLDLLFEHPVVSSTYVQERLGCAFVTAQRIIGQFVNHGLLIKTSTKRRNQQFRYDALTRMFESSEANPTQGAEP